MATVGNSFKTLADLGKEMNPDQASVAQTIEVLAQDNEILDDVNWMQGNLTTGHRSTVRTSLPNVGFKRANRGVPNAKSTSANLDEAAAQLLAYSKIDADIVDLSPDGPQTRMNEDSAFVEGLNQKFSSTLMYGNAGVNPDEFNGFSSRFTTGVPGTPYENNMIDAGGSGTDNMSIWLVGWGNRTVSGIYPRNTAAGLRTEDLGRVTEEDANGYINTWWMTRFDWKCGLAVMNWKAVVRICNIDYSLLKAGSGAKLNELMISAQERLPSATRSDTYRPTFYMPKIVRERLRIQAVNQATVNLSYENFMGRQVTMFDGIPCRVVDSLTASEAAVPFA